MIRPIFEWPHPVLGEVSRVVDTTPRGLGVIEGLIRDLTETMRDAKGCGISAIQVGEALRLFVLNTGGLDEVYINPEWTPWKGTEPVLMDEGCLSVRNPKEWKTESLYFRAMVPRYERINVTYTNQAGARVTDKFRGLKAQAFQHESEHLDGRIFLDHLSEERKALLE